MEHKSCGNCGYINNCSSSPYGSCTVCDLWISQDTKVLPNEHAGAKPCRTCSKRGLCMKIVIPSGYPCKKEET